MTDRNLLNKAIEISYDINPDNAEELTSILTREDWIDLFNLYFTDIESYFILKENIASFIVNTSQFYFEDQLLQETYIQLLWIDWLFWHLLIPDNDEKNIEIESIFNKRKIQKIVLDILSHYNYHFEMKLNIYLNLFNYIDIKDTDFEKELFNNIKENNTLENTYLKLLNNETYKYLLFQENILSKLLLWFNSTRLKDFLIALMLSYTTSKEERSNFILSNLDIILNHDIFLIKPEDILLTLSILSTNRLEENRKKEYINEISITKFEKQEFLSDNIIIKNKEHLRKLYNNWIYINIKNINYIINSNDIKQLNLDNFNTEIKLLLNTDFNLNKIKEKHLTILLIHAFENNNKVLIKRIIKDLSDNDNKTIELLSSVSKLIRNNEIDIDNKNIHLLKELLNTFIETNYNECLDIIISLITIKKEQNGMLDLFELKNVLESLKIDDLVKVLEINEDTENESIILDVIYSKVNEDEFYKIYINNLFLENDFDNSEYLFSYDKIITDLWRWKSDIETIKKILLSEAFYNGLDIKKWQFIEYLIDNQESLYDKINIIFFIIDNQEKIFNKSASIILKWLLTKFFWDQNILEKYSKRIEEYTNKIVWIENNQNKKWFIGSFLDNFNSKKENKYEKLVELYRKKSEVEGVNKENEEQIKNMIEEIDIILSFIEKYKQLFIELDLLSLLDELKIMKEQFIQMIR